MEQQITTKPFTEEEQTKFGVALTRQLFDMVNNDIDNEGKSDLITEFRKNILLDFRNSIDNKNEITEKNQVIKELNETKTYENMEELEKGFFLSRDDKNTDEVKTAKANKKKFMSMVKQLRENCGNMYNSYNKHKEYDILFYMVDDLFNEIEELDNFIENRYIYIGHINMISNIFVSYFKDTMDNKINENQNTNGYFLLELFYENYKEITEELNSKIIGIPKPRKSFIDFEESKYEDGDEDKYGEGEGEDEQKGGRSYKKNKHKRKRKPSKKKTLKKKRKKKRETKK